MHYGVSDCMGIIGMVESAFGYMLDPLREMLHQKGMILGEYKRISGKKIFGVTSDILPAEVLYALDILVIRIPVRTTSINEISAVECCVAYNEMPEGLFDVIVTPENHDIDLSESTVGTSVLYSFPTPGGYGDTAAVEFNRGLNELLWKKLSTRIEFLDERRLESAAVMYNTLRQLVRGICTVRNSNPKLLAHADLQIVFEAAMSFPPDMLLEQFTTLLQTINRGPFPEEAPEVKALVAGGWVEDMNIFDSIESSGCIVVEDDICNGRRQFDLSINCESKHLYAEILDAFSYRPLCPGIRTPGERYDLLYGLLGNYGIEMVIFLEDTFGPKAHGDIEYLRKKLMRSGIDPLIVTKDEAGAVVKRYIMATGDYRNLP